MTQKKNKFWTFCFSFIPGAAEMYMGFMKMGLSLMSIFTGIFAIAVTFEFGSLIFLAGIAWFYSFFHAHNLSAMQDEDFYALEDDYFFHLSSDYKVQTDFFKIYRKSIAGLLIFFGIVYTWQNFVRFLYNWVPDYIYQIVSNFSYRLPKLAMGVAIIVIGILMIRGKKKELEKEEDKNGTNNTPTENE